MFSWIANKPVKPEINWGYDAAGNRSYDSSNSGSWSFDNLNRMVSSPQGSYTHDILGNHLTGPGSVSMTWDLLNRMISYTKASGSTSYSYRAHGMRVQKSNSVSTTAYRLTDRCPLRRMSLTLGRRTFRGTSLEQEASRQLYQTTYLKIQMELRIGDSD
jgi:outer membrane protein assembly factor BamA